MVNFKHAIYAIGIVLFFHALGLIFSLYSIFSWYDIPMHAGGGFAMGLLGIAIWNSAVQEVHFHSWFEKHLKWWFLPGVILGFVSLIGIFWELYEYVFDVWIDKVPNLRQPSIGDTMLDFVMDLVGGAIALLFLRRK